MTIRALALSLSFVCAFQGPALAVERKSPSAGVQHGVKKPTVKPLTVQECLGLGGDTQANAGCANTGLICITNKGKPNEHKLCVTE